MMINKKGLSNIIATVLIILLALAAVVIVWQFVRPTISNSGQNVQLQSQCLEIDAVPITCTIDAQEYDVNVTVKNGTPFKIIGIAQDSDGTINTGIADPPSAYGIATIIIQDSNADSNGKVKVAAMVGDSTKNQTCAPSDIQINCS